MKENISWETYEFQYKKKTADWFWAVGIITVSIAIISIIYSDALFAIFIIIAGFMVGFLGNKEPKILEVKIDEKGIHLNDTTYPFQNIKTFWVEDNKYSAPKLILKIDKAISSLLVIPIETDYYNSTEIRSHLLNHVVEEKNVEPFSHKIMESLGF